MSTGRQEQRNRGLRVLHGGGEPKGSKWDPDALAALVEGTAARQERTYLLLEDVRTELDNFMRAQMAHNAWVMKCMKLMMAKMGVGEPAQAETDLTPKKTGVRRRR